MTFRNSHGTSGDNYISIVHDKIEISYVNHLPIFISQGTFGPLGSAVNFYLEPPIILSYPDIELLNLKTKRLSILF